MLKAIAFGKDGVEGDSCWHPDDLVGFWILDNEAGEFGSDSAVYRHVRSMKILARSMAIKTLVRESLVLDVVLTTSNMLNSGLSAAINRRRERQ